MAEMLANELAQAISDDDAINSNTEKISVPVIIANAVDLYVKQSKSINTVEKLELKIEMMENFTFPEIDVQPGENEKFVQAIIRIPGKENTINFSVDIEKLGDSINIEELIKEISRELEKLSMTTSFLEKLADSNEMKKVTIPEIIANAVGLYANEGKSIDSIEKLELKIEMMEFFPFPEIDVQPSKNENLLQATLILINL